MANTTATPSSGNQLRLRLPLTVKVHGEPAADRVTELSNGVAQAFRHALQQSAVEAQRQGLHLVSTPLTQLTMLTPTFTVREGLGDAGILEPAVRRGIDEGLSGAFSILAEYRSPRLASQVTVLDPPDRPPLAAGRSARRVGRAWRIQRSATIRVQLRTFVEFLESTGDPAAGEEIRSLYLEMLDDVRPVVVWLVRTNTTILVDDLVEQVSQRALALKPQSATIWYYWTYLESSRRKLLALDEKGSLTWLPNMTYNPGRFLPNGRAEFRPGGMLLFVRTTLPLVRREGVIRFGAEIPVYLRLRDLDFLIDAARFEQFSGVPWTTYLQEFGNKETVLWILPVYPLRRVHYQMLSYLSGQEVETRVESESYSFGGLRLLNQSTLDSLPSQARGDADRLSNDVTRRVSQEEERGYWETDWRGAFISAALTPSKEDLATAQFRPEARRLADQLIPLLQRDPTELLWPHDFVTFLRQHYIRGTVFEFLLDELRSRDGDRWFERLFDAVEEADDWAAHHLLISLALHTTRYANHPRVGKTIRLLNTRRQRRDLAHVYKPDEQEIWLDADPGKKVGLTWPGSLHPIVADVDPDYSLEKTGQRINEEKRKALEEAMPLAANEMLREIASGRDTRTYSQEEFTAAVIGNAAQKVGFTEDDIEEFTIEISLELISIEKRIEEGLERFYITYQYVERIDKGYWKSVPNTRETITDSEFEWMLLAWRMKREGEAIIFWSKVSVWLSVGAIALEVGAVSLLLRLAGGAVRLAGGAVNVGVSIGFSWAWYIVRSIYHNRWPTLEGFVRATVEGYLMALGFRVGAGIVGGGISGGRWIASEIGADSLRRVIVGWVGERVLVGAGWATERAAIGGVGGGITGGLLKLSEDITDMILGRKTEFSSPEEYVRHMKWGAVIGIAFELGLGAAAPLVAPEMRWMHEVIQGMLRARISPSRWAEIMEQASARYTQQMRNAFAERIASETASEFHRILWGRWAQFAVEYRLAFLQRALEAGRVELSVATLGGLRKLSAASGEHLSLEATLELLTRISRRPEQAQRFLEAINLLDEPVLRELARSGQIEALANSANLLNLMQQRGGYWTWVRLDRAFGGSVADMDRFLTRLSRQGAEQQAQVLEVLGRADLRIDPNGLLIVLERTGGLSNESLAGLNRLYETSLGRSELETFLRTASQEPLANLLTHIGMLPAEMVERLASGGYLQHLVRSPRVLEFASQPGNVERLMGYVSRSRDVSVAEAIKTLERYLQRKANLSAEEIRGAVELNDSLGLAIESGGLQPMVQLPARRSGEPPQVLEIGSGPTRTYLGIPEDVVHLVRTDKAETFPVDRVLDAEGKLPDNLVGAFDTVIINNPRDYIPNLEEIGRAVRPGGRIIVQGNTGRNPDFRRLVNNVRTPRGFRKETLPEEGSFVPKRDLPPEFSPSDPEAIRRNILGGPFSRTSAEGPVFPNYRAVFTKTQNIRSTGTGGGESPVVSPAGERSSLLKQATQAGVREVIEEGPIAVFAHGTTARVAQELVETQGGNLAARGGQFGGQFFTLPSVEVAKVFAARSASGVAGVQPAVVGIALPQAVVDRLRAQRLLQVRPIPNPPPGVSPGAQQWVFQPGALDTLKNEGFFFHVQ